MSISISSSFALASLASANAAPTPAASRPVQPTTNNSGDSVTLTQAQQVYQLYNQGQTVPQIALSLSLPVEAVNTFLGISGGSS
jgi:hypothetical protein